MRPVFYLANGRWGGCAGVVDRHVRGMRRAWLRDDSVPTHRSCAGSPQTDEKGGDDRPGHHGQGPALSAERKDHGPLPVPLDESSAYGSCRQARRAMNRR